MSHMMVHWGFIFIPFHFLQESTQYLANTYHPIYNKLHIFRPKSLGWIMPSSPFSGLSTVFCARLISLIVLSILFVWLIAFLLCILVWPLWGLPAGLIGSGNKVLVLDCVFRWFILDWEFTASDIGGILWERSSRSFQRFLNNIYKMLPCGLFFSPLPRNSVRYVALTV